MEDILLPRSKEIIDLTADRYHINRTVQAAEAAYTDKESGLIIGFSKSLVEGVCKSTLDEHRIEYPSDIKVGKLAKIAVGSFGVKKGLENERKTAEAFKKMISSAANHLETAVQGIGELRNDFCPLAHGKSSNHTPLDLHYAKFIAKQSDSIVGFIFDLRESYVSAEPYVEPVRDTDFDEFLNDEFEPVVIYGNTFLPSEILFNVAPEEYLKNFEERNESLEGVDQ